MKGKSIKKTQKDKEESIESILEKTRDPKLRAITQRLYEKSKASNIGFQAQETARDIQKAIAPDGKIPPEQLHLAFIPMPTDMCRVSPFFPMARQKLKERPYIRDMVITSSSWGEIKYTGPKLSTYDEDALLAVLSILDSAENRQTTEIKDQRTYTYRGPLLPVLKKMGYTKFGRTNYKRAIDSLELMTVAGVKLIIYKRTSRGKRKIKETIMNSMFAVAKWNEENKELVITVNPYFYECYMAGSVTLLDVKLRSKIKSPIAKSLYRFMQSHRSVQWEGHFLTLSASLNLDQNQPMWKIRQLVKLAINELIKKRFLIRGSGFRPKSKDIVKLIRHPSITTLQK